MKLNILNLYLSSLSKKDMYLLTKIKICIKIIRDLFLTSIDERLYLMKFLFNFSFFFQKIYQVP